MRYVSFSFLFSTGLEVPRVRLTANFAPANVFPGIFHIHAPVAIFMIILFFAKSVNFLFLQIPWAYLLKVL
jgi:hypothetical protein